MKNALSTMLRFLTFRAMSDELQKLGWPHLAIGFFFVWMAGIARNWDNEKAEFLQTLGVGSLIYVFALATLLTIIVAPFLREGVLSVYRRVLTVVCLTAPPALLYGIPVEMWMDASTARSMNYSLLAFVATWRVALWAFYLGRGARFSWPQTLVCTLLPLCVIVGIFGFFGILANVGDIMGGVRTPMQKEALHVASVLFQIALYSFLPLLITYIFQVKRYRPDERI